MVACMIATGLKRAAQLQMSLPSPTTPGTDSADRRRKGCLVDMSYLFSAGIFVQLALLFYVLGLLTRNELLLRVQILIGTSCYILYYYFIGDTPLWDAIWASCVIGAANLFMIAVILWEKSTVGMSPQMRALYGSFPTSNPGQFRKIMKSATWITAEQDTQICERGVHLEHLFLIASGNAVLSQNGRNYEIGHGNFIGEISFLIGGPASADVIAPKGTEYVRWERDTLREHMKKSTRMSNAISAMFNLDIAHKLARSGPIYDFDDSRVIRTEQAESSVKIVH